MDDSIIVLSDDDSDDCNFFQKTKSDGNDDCSIVRDKADSDLSESEFPIVRFSEINYNPNLKKNSRTKKVDSSHLSDFNYSDKNDSRKRNSDEDMAESPILETNSKKVSSTSKSVSRSKKYSEDSYYLQNLVTDSLKEKEWSNFDLAEVNTENNNCLGKNTNHRNKSDSDSDYESQCVLKNVREKKADVELSDDSEKSDDKRKVVKKTVRKRKNKTAQQAGIADNDEGSHPKPTKKRGTKATSKTNPKDSMKMMEVILDDEITSYDFFNDFSKVAEENEITYRVKSQLIPKSITWKRKVETNDEQELSSNIKIVDENQLVLIWDCEETVKHVSEKTFVSAISNIKTMMSNKKISLVIYKMQSYFKYLKSSRGQKNSDNDKPKKNRTKSSRDLSNYPKISIEQLNECLVEIQLMHNTNSRLIENPDDMVVLIQQYTKSLATLPSKKEQSEKLSEIDWCISVDNKDSVKIDREGNGLIRLWQQQLCQFAQTSLETSEAIATVYKSPSQLMEAYAKCNQIEGELLLKDIPIRRNAGMLTSSKKIGPELSKKFYIMFTSTDGDTYLNDC